MIFHVPVIKLWPALAEDYLEKIESPQDLTTVECKLSEGGHFKDRRDFLSAVSTIFENAMTWNAEDFKNHVTIPSSYYEAGEHLAKYCKWLVVFGYEAGWFWKDGEMGGEPGDDAFSVTAEGREKTKGEMDEVFMSTDKAVCGWEVGRFGVKKEVHFSEKQVRAERSGRQKRTGSMMTYKKSA